MIELGISRPIKGIKERITGKEGLLRNHLMGKRVEFSGRTVIGPDPYLKFGEMGLPIQVAQQLTYPECVQKYNIEHLKKIVEEGKANSFIKKENGSKIYLNHATKIPGTKLLYGDIITRKNREIVVDNKITIELQDGDLFRREGLLQYGDKIIRNGKRITIYDELDQNLFMGDKIERKGKIICNIDPPRKKSVELKYGDIVLRHLRNGDTLLINRQPTLHGGSMLAKKIRILPGKTFRLNLSCTKSFNADFNIGIKQEA